jgi:2-amino-4-hydroxy-6-hydroxymethyldihydropteridine diphosphokinase
VTVPVVFIALGSNQGDRSALLERGLALLADAVHIVKRSAVYETEPKYVTDQPIFLNIVIEGHTELPPEPLLDMLKSIEMQLGRIAGRRYGPRPIDLDILFYDDLIMETPRLTIPHPRLQERRFVLQPLADIAAGHCHPGTGETIADMLATLPAEDDVRLFEG